jgi:hypothetical protein
MLLNNIHNKIFYLIHLVQIKFTLHSTTPLNSYFFHVLNFNIDKDGNFYMKDIGGANDIWGIYWGKGFC